MHIKPTWAYNTIEPQRPKITFTRSMRLLKHLLWEFILLCRWLAISCDQFNNFSHGGFGHLMAKPSGENCWLSFGVNKYFFGSTMNSVHFFQCLSLFHYFKLSLERNQCKPAWQFQQLTKVLEEEEEQKPNPITQRIKIIMVRLQLM